jgi:hypothetical protein
MEGLVRPDRYILYRWESDVVHASTTGLGQLVNQSGPITVVGVPGNPGQLLARLVATWEAACDLQKLVAEVLNYDLPGWEEQRQSALDELTALAQMYGGKSDDSSSG